MLDDLVVDASVVAKLYFSETDSDLAIEALRSAGRLIAPELLFLEIASVSAKQVRRGLVPEAAARAAMSTLADLLDEPVPLAGLASDAFSLAAEHGFSAYDGAYLALAQARGLRMITADERLVRRAETSGLAHLVRPLRSAPMT